MMGCTISHIIVTYRRPYLDVMNDINLNGARGFYGPGSYRCGEGHCDVTGPCIIQSPIVTYGPGQTIHLRKRFTCGCKNLVYLLFCNECLRLGRSTTYLGESEQAERNIHKRFAVHKKKFSGSTLDRLVPKQTIPTVVQGILGGNGDPNSVMQDPYTHFTFVHPPTNGNDNRRYAFLDGGFPTIRSRKLCETKYLAFFGDNDYNYTTHSGNFNHL